MEKNQMKNIVILKNLPSNLIEEAFVIVKSKKLAKQIEMVNVDIESEKEKKREQGYAIREAEMIICDYINGFEKNKNKKIEVNKILKIYSLVITIMLILFFIVIKF